MQIEVTRCRNKNKKEYTKHTRIKCHENFVGLCASFHIAINDNLCVIIFFGGALVVGVIIIIYTVDNFFSTVNYWMCREPPHRTNWAGIVYYKLGVVPTILAVKTSAVIIVGVYIVT